MSATRRVHRRLASRRAAGQSIPLIALMIVVLIAMVGLSVDVGNTFSQERRAVLAANSASLTGMNEVLKTNATNGKVYGAIQDTLAANGIDAVPAGTQPGPGQLVWQGYYLDRDGAPVGNDNTIPNNGTRPDQEVAFVQVALSGEVDTYFARVVGRNDLPVAAQSYAGICPPGNGVYPIGVNVELVNLTTNVFRQPPAVTGNGNGNTFDWQYQRISDPRSPYINKTRLRIPLHHKFPGSTSTSGNFGFLNWTGAPGTGSAPALSERLTFPGNLSKGYLEVPASDLEGFVDQNTYPPDAGSLSPGDYIWGDSGAPNNAISTALADHKQRGTEMVLPIYDPAVLGNGNNSKFKVVSLGSFVVMDYNIGGANGYIDLVYLGDPTNQRGACNVSSVPSNRYYELGGNVSFYPQYQARLNARVPVRFVLVLDVSGSMNANFAGQCNRNSSGNTVSPAVQCTASTAADGVTLTTATVGGGYWWSNSGERRHIVAMEAVKSLINIANMGTRYNPALSPAPDEMAMIKFNDEVSPTGNAARFNSNGNFSNGGSKYFSNNPAGLEAAITDIYEDRTGGGTNGAAGLYRAYNLINSAPPMVNASGQPVEFRTVVIFVTDGVSNVLFHEEAKNYSAGGNSGDSARATYPTDSNCRATDSNGNYVVKNLAESAPCQMNEAGFRTSGVTRLTVQFRNQANQLITRDLSRPITQMGEVSSMYLKPIGGDGKPRAEVFVIGLSGATKNGMASVVSNNVNTNFFLVTDSSRLDDAFRDIYNRTSNATCPVVELPLQGALSSSQFVNTGSFAYPKVGEVSISGTTSTGETITDLRAPILADANDNNKLKYLYPNVPAGEYTLTARLFYRFPDDISPTPREYSMFGENQPSAQVIVSATTPAGSLKGRTDFPLTLRLNGTIPPTCPVTP